MKFIALIGLTLIIFSCKKETITPTNSLVGTWNWTSTNNTVDGFEQSSSQHYQQLKFLDFETYTWTENDTVHYQGSYNLDFIYNPSTQSNKWILTFHGTPSPGNYIVDQNGASLKLTEKNFTDSLVYKFVK